MVKRKYSKVSMRKPMSRSMKESYSDIDYSNVWDAYDVAMGYLGAEEFCEALAKAMGTDELESNLKYIFRVYDIPFGDDEEEFDEGCHRKSKKRRKSMKESKDNDVYVVFRKYYNEYTDTYEPIAFIYGGGMKASYGRVNIIEQDGIVPHMNNPRYVHDEADISYINKTKPLGVDDPNYDAFSEYVLDELRSDGMNPVIRLKINQYAVRDGWKR